MTQLTIELPDHLAEQLQHYLKTNPQETLASLLYDALHVKLTPKDSSQLLTLAGIIHSAPRGAADHAEDFAEDGKE